ncbi:MAG TPA: RDD family protein [Kofleriaceae bacterium]|nr:RDD family protein [Kofleriaceae bacterium]
MPRVPGRPMIDALRGDDPRMVRSIVTPEGIPLRFTLARAGDRAAAFLLDLLLQIVLAVGILWGLTSAVGGADSWLTAAIVVLAFFLLNFYFAFFEIRWQGATPGKRQIGIRVIDARGGQLETSAVLARNLVRELEVWTPLRFLFASHLVWPGAPTWARLLAGGWAFVFLFMPLFNRDRLRVGDLIAGTRVVLHPRVVLMPDLVDESAPAPVAVPSVAAPPGAAGAPIHAFSDAQLSIYGIYELQVLEGVLRGSPTDAAHREAVQAVAEKVRAKIGYQGKVADDERFLREFYVAQRAHLEQRMLFGQRREDKFSK